MNRRIGSLAAFAVAGTLLLGAVGSAAAADTAKVRVLHGSPDAPAVDVVVDGSKVLTAVPFGVISNYLTVPAGAHRVQVFATGTMTGAVIDANLTLDAGKAYTVAATNAVAKIEAQVIVDDPAASCSTAQIRAVHLSADAPAVDVAPNGSAADAALVKGLVYPKNTGYMAVKAGAYNLDVRLAGTTTVALALGTLNVADCNSYSVFVVGSAASPAVGGNGLKAIVAVDATATAPKPSAAPSMTPPPTATAGATTSSTGTSLPLVLGFLALFGVASLGALRLAGARSRTRG
jgi:hypothetical protein